MAALEVWPALDILAGQVVRLTQGDYDRETRYADDPVALLETRLHCMPPRIHLIDLDGARQGEFTAWSVLQRLAVMGVRVEAGGGFRTMGAIDRALAHGAERVILGTRLLSDAHFAQAALRHFGASRLVASLDVRQGRAQVQGWLEEGADALDTWDTLWQVGYRLVNVTDISGDGTLRGLDEQFWQPWTKVPGNVGAGGGIASPDDLRRLESWGIPRAVVGKAWLEGQIDLKEVIPC